MLIIWLHLGILNIFPTILLLISNRKYKTQFGSQYINGFEEMKSTGNSLILQQKIYVGVVFARKALSGSILGLVLPNRQSIYSECLWNI